MLAIPACSYRLVMANYNTLPSDEIEDSEPLNENITSEEIQLTTGKLLKVRELTLLNLNMLKENIEKRYVSTRKAKVAGGLLSLLGSFFSIVCFGLNFVPSDIASWVMALISALPFMAGGLLMLSADILYYVESRTKLNDAIIFCCNDCKLMKDLEPLGGKFKKLYNKQDDWCKKIGKCQYLKEAVKQINPCIKVVFCLFYGYKLLDAIITIGRSVLSVIIANSDHETVAITHEFWDDFNKVQRGYKIFTTVVSGASIVFEIIMMFYNSCTCKKKYSNYAKMVQELITKLNNELNIQSFEYFCIT